MKHINVTNLAGLILIAWLSLPAVALAATWAQVADSEISNYRAADADTIVKAQLLTTYALNPRLHTYPIQISVKQGTVYLGGSVTSPLQKALAEGIATSIKGINKVIDNIIVDPATPQVLLKGSYAQRVADLNLTADVTAALQETPELTAFPITVSTLNGTVTLTGEVPSFMQKDIATKVATKVPGAVMINNNLKVVANG